MSRTTSSVVLAVKRGRSRRAGAPANARSNGRKGGLSCSFGGVGGGPLPCSSLLMDAFNAMFETRSLSHMLSPVELRNLSLVARPFRHFQKQVWRITRWTTAAREAMMKGFLPLLMEVDIADLGQSCKKPFAPALTNLKHLQTIRLTRPRILAGGLRALGKKLSGLPRLTTLEVIGYEFRQGTGAVRAFMDGVARAASLRRLFLDTGCYPLELDGVEAVGRALSALALESLRYRGGVALLPALTTALPHLALTLLELDVDLTTWMEDDGERAAFLRALSAVSRLEVLRLDDIKLQEHPAQLSQTLSVLQNVRVLKLHPGGHRSGMMEAHLFRAIANLPELRQLDVKMKLGADGAAAVANVLANAHALESLILISCNLGDGGCKALAAGLQGEHHPNLKHLDLSCNNVEQEGVMALASLITNFPRLQRLGLRWLRDWGSPYHGVELGPREFIAPLAHAAATLPCLVQLDLNDNIVLEAGARALARLVTSSTSLRCLRISNCIEANVSLQSVFMEELRSADRPSLLQELHAEASPPLVAGLPYGVVVPVVQDSEADIVEGALARLSHLRTLNLSGWVFGAAGVEGLIAAVRRGCLCELRTLTLTSCWVGREDVPQLAGALKAQCPHLRTVAPRELDAAWRSSEQRLTSSGSAGRWEGWRR